MGSYFGHGKDTSKSSHQEEFSKKDLVHMNRTLFTVAKKVLLKEMDPETRLKFIDMKEAEQEKVLHLILLGEKTVLSFKSELKQGFIKL